MSAALLGVAGAVVSPVVATTSSMRVNEAAVAVGVVAYAAVGALILWHLPGHPIGRLILGAATLWGLGEGLLGLAVRALQTDSDQPAWALAATLGTTARGLGGLVLIVWLPFRFPDGIPVSPARRDRVPEALSLATLGAFLVVALLSPLQTDLRLADVGNPIGLPPAMTPVTEGLAALMLLLGTVVIVLAVLSVARRWRRESALGRQRLLWFALAFSVPVVLMGLSFGDLAAPWMFGVATLPVPVAIAVAIFQRRLYDVQLAVNRSLVFGALWITIAGLYAVTVGGVGAMLDRRGETWVSWVAAAVVAVSFAPLREGLQQAANRLTFGRWSQPQQVLAGVGRRLSDAGDVPVLLRTLADELRQDLGFDVVRIDSADGTTLASSGDAEPDEVLPVLAYGRHVGLLRWRGPRLRDADQQLLADVANQLGSVLHSASLLAALRASQERLVVSREEERKRLRRDLHDGLGPTLAALALQVDTARNRWPAADQDLLALRDTVQAAVADVRRVVEGLRPPALDELGLVEAVRRLAGRLDESGGLRVQVEAGELPVLPAAVEVAAYRIVQEAVANAVRHSHGTCCLVELAADAELEVMVRDNGSGTVAPRPGGLGSSTMRERAEEIGGRVDVVAAPGAGTTVRVRLPLSGGAS